MNILILGPESRNKNIIEFLESRNHNIDLTVESITLALLKEKGIDFLLSFGYAPILKPPITTEYRHRIVNIHPAYLPEGRGIHPNFWSFFEGKPKGVSIHFILDAGIDTGDIIARKEVSFSDNETLRTTYAQLDREVEKLFFQVWDDIENGRCEPIPQEELTDKYYYHNRTESERFLDLFPRRWDTPVTEVEDMGADVFLSTQFWKNYEREIQAFV